jgi:hypothetical protein
MAAGGVQHVILGEELLDVGQCVLCAGDDFLRERWPALRGKPSVRPADTGTSVARSGVVMTPGNGRRKSRRDVVVGGSSRQKVG